jgi:hypothetical protein
MAGNREPYVDYLVNADWAFNLLQARKLTTGQVREIVLRTCKNTYRLLQNLDVLERAYEQQRQEALERAAKDSLREEQCQFLRLPQVDAWLQNFQHHRTRQPFLVLEGRSGVGKTQFALSLVPPNAALELNCATTVEPDLRRYRQGQHELILLDEARPQLALACKKLLQGNPCPIQMAQSATNCNAYTVWVHNVKFVICSNTWSDDVARCSAADQEWLTANAVHVVVAERLWQPRSE